MVGSKKIKFIPSDLDSKTLYLPPTPSSSTVPTWFKELPQRFYGQKKLTLSVNSTGNSTNANLKMCVPFLDAMTFGYTVVLSHDVLVQKSNHPKRSDVQWRAGGETFLTTHNVAQTDGVPIPSEYCDIAYKWSGQWGIETPAGYSCFFTHPINRVDLPFLTLSGVVDTDKYILPVQFPFLLKKDFEGILERGTPIAQVIPFKREPWSSTQEDYDRNRMVSQFYEWRGLMERSYKRLHWSKKSFK
jgi:hypothetical protein